MKRIWSIEQKVSILNEAKTLGIVETCRKHGIYATIYYSWKQKYEFDDIHQCREVLHRYYSTYNNRRTISSLLYLPPSVFLNEWGN